MIYPHRVLKRLQEQKEVRKIVLGVGYGAGVPMDVQLSPMSSDAQAHQFGISFQRGYYLQWDIADGEMDPLTLLEDVEGRQWLVRTPTNRHEFGNAADHCNALAELLEYETDHVERTPDEAAAFGDVAVAMSGRTPTMLGGGGMTP